MFELPISSQVLFLSQRKKLLHLTYCVKLLIGKQEPTGITVGEWLTKWITEIHINKVGQAHYRSYLHNINNHLIPALGHIKLSKLMPSDIERYYASALNKVGRYGKTLSRRTVELHGTISRQSLKYAVNTEGLLAVNQANKVSLITPDTQTPIPWSKTELKTFLYVARPHRLFFSFWLMAYTGARRGELLALKWTDFDGKRIAITKSGRMTSKTKGGDGNRYITLDPDTIKEWYAHLDRQGKELDDMGEAWTETGYVFVREDGKPIDEGTVIRLFSKLLKRAGLRHSRLHDLRHLHATELLWLGTPLHVVSKRLGHATTSVTADIYAHVTDEQADTTSTTFADNLNST